MTSKYRPLQFCIVSVIVALIVMIENDFGKSPVSISGRHAHDEVMSVLIPLFVMVAPVFIKKLRDTWWTKTNIILTCLFFIVNLTLVILMKINLYNYYTDNGSNVYWGWLLY